MNSNNQMQVLKELIRKSTKLDSPCVLCGIMTRQRGLFIPNKAYEWGGMPGKDRVIIYPICGKHHSLSPTDHKTIEDHIRMNAGNIKTVNCATVTPN